MSAVLPPEQFPDWWRAEALRRWRRLLAIPNDRTPSGWTPGQRDRLLQRCLYSAHLDLLAMRIDPAEAGRRPADAEHQAPPDRP